MSSPLGIVVIVFLALLGLSFAIGGEEPPAPAAAPVALIAERVEALRGRRFKTVPRAVTVSPERAREEGLADLDRGYPAAARTADETLYAMLDLVPEGTDLREISASLFGEQVAGYYDPRTGRLRVVEGTGGNRFLDEITLAHELTHALEDQVFTLDTDAAEDSGDAGYAYRALAEGTATALMLEYASRHFGAEEALGGLLSGSLTISSSTPLPPFVQAGFTWPYLGGQTFVQELYASAGRTWRLVDVALEARPPASTEQVLHPEKWLRVEQPLDVVAPRSPGPGWTRRTGGTFGEWQTGQLVGTEAAAGWGGDRYALWTRGRERALAMRWRWDSPADAGEFEGALRRVEWPEGVESTIRHRGGEVRLGLATAVSIADLLVR